jgi:hypothetical protein
MLNANSPSSSDGETHLQRLSIEALRHAERYTFEHSIEISARLYFYNRLPASAEWRRRFPSPGAIADYLEIEGGDAASGGGARWFSWRRADAGNGIYKLYVSPHISAIKEAFAAVVEATAAHRAAGFKVGRDVYGLLRPDKLVAYFVALDELKEAAETLRTRLEGAPVQGVPFSAQIDSRGLLSWGIEPPPSECYPVAGRFSWRRWVTDRLAVSLLAGRDSPVGEGWRFAFDRIRLDGIDPQSWTPLWTTAA